MRLGFPSVSVVKNPPTSAGDARSISGPERLPLEGNGNPVFLPGEIPWTEKPGRLQSMELQRVRHSD